MFGAIGPVPIHICLKQSLVLQCFPEMRASYVILKSWNGVFGAIGPVPNHICSKQSLVESCSAVLSEDECLACVLVDFSPKSKV